MVKRGTNNEARDDVAAALHAWPPARWRGHRDRWIYGYMAGYDHLQSDIQSAWRGIEVRKHVLDRDGWRCKRCGRAGSLEVHHLKPLEDGGEPYNPNNLESICRGCHIQVHREIIGETEWRALLHAIV